ncbi:recombinase family protein [Desulfosporosinus sp. BG]|uniref:recombinase family protein n=1 Tax=Desulfosporosinus sp. BG TaxID=1633135 RepID=UPI00083A0085|nr:recombinase family protein [Desulfosporosinus sp. BG]ODA41248.1 Site-specific recombinase [Desulfosporosinus sp. BG]
MEPIGLKGISKVFLYLRKSRDEEDKGIDVLDNHKRTLLEICNRNGWKKPEIYQEIKSGSSLEYRDELKRMLSDIEKGLADVVLCMDVDRLSRGSGADWERIKSAFKDNAVFLMTPTALYDYSNIENEFMGDLLAVFARYEWNQIRKRYKRGKITNAEKGHYVNGTAPFGYDYNSTTKILEPNPEQAEVVRYIFDRALEGIAPQNIAIELNKKGLRSPRGTNFSQTFILRLLKNQVFTGRIVFGKSSGSGHINRQTAPLKFKPKSEWIVSDKSHEPLISDEDFGRLQEMIKERTKIPTKSRANTHPLSSLIKCGKCGRVHGLQFRANGSTLLKPCPGISPTGVKCKNGGIHSNILHEILDAQLQDHIEKLNQDKPVESGRFKNLQFDLKAKTQSIGELTDRLDRLNDIYIEGRLKKDKYEKQFDQLTVDIEDAKHEVERLTEALANYKGMNPEERIKKVIELRDVFNNPDVDNTDKNRLAKALIDKILYKRDGDEVEMEVVFL